MKECFDQYYQPIENTSQNLKSLTSLFNSSHSKPLPNSNQTNNYSTAFMTFIMFLLFAIMMPLYYKYANKFLHRNENADRGLPMNQLGNKKTRRRSSIKNAEPLCLNLISCVESCEQKRGY